MRASTPRTQEGSISPQRPGKRKHVAGLESPSTFWQGIPDNRTPKELLEDRAAARAWLQSADAVADKVLADPKHHERFEAWKESFLGFRKKKAKAEESAEDLE